MLHYLTSAYKLKLEFMYSFKLAFRRLFRKGEHTITRITSLSLGLAFGILLLSEALYYFSYDSFYPDANRVYIVHENFKVDKANDALESYPRVSGAIAPGLKAEVPGIEAATRLNSIGSSVFYTEDLKGYKAEFSLADEYLFDILPRPVISGNPKEILKTPMACMVSHKIAESMGGNVVGKSIEIKKYPGKKLTIAGVFEAIPENTNYTCDVLISMVSTAEFTWDGTQNWLGNDRYYACVRLAPGVTPESLAPAVRQMQEKNQDIKQIELSNPGFVLKYTFEPITKIFAKNTKDIILILSFIAFAVLFVSIMNYTLLSISVLVNRAKSSAILKCCGAQEGNVRRLVFAETALLFIISLLTATLIIGLLQPLAEAQVGHSLSAAFTPTVLVPLATILAAILLVTGYFPGRLFSKIPVATALRSNKHDGNKWKLALLSLQVIGAAVIFAVLVIVTLQYDMMKNSHHGYDTENIYYANTSGMEGHKISTVINELRAMPEVELVGLGSTLPINGASGNNVLSADRERELFNIADFYYIDASYFSILNIPVIEGENFTDTTASPNDLLISRKCAELLKLNLGWTDGAIGKQIEITEHNANGATTIKGVFPDFIISTITNADTRPAVFFFMPQERFEQRRIESPSFPFLLLIRTHGGNNHNIIKRITDVINTALPFGDAEVKSLAAEQQQKYVPQRGLRNAMIAGNIVIILVTIIGLMGYTTSEVTRRRKELAIRKINGASLGHLLKMFIKDLEITAIPAVAIGLAAAWYIATKWMQNFADKIPLSWWIFGLCSAFILLLIAVVSAINYTRIANRNPVESLRYE